MKTCRRKLVHAETDSGKRMEEIGLADLTELLPENMREQ